MKFTQATAVLLLSIGTIAKAQTAQQLSSNPKLLPPSTYPYWGSYNPLQTEDLANITAQAWNLNNHAIEGWDWSLPANTKPAERSSVGLQRLFGFAKPFVDLKLKFEANSIGLLWVTWRELEPTRGNYKFEPLIERIKQAASVGVKVSLRILAHSKARGSKEGEAPLWLSDLGVPLLPFEDGDNENYDPADPNFHKSYLALIKALKDTEIPALVKAAYVGYASSTYGDEGIGPFGETKSAENDKVPHVRERLDAWAAAFPNMTNKVYMGAPCNYGFEKGFGSRRGFVEMYLYRIPNQDMGQYVDDKGYLRVDESAPVIRYKGINGEVNEEYSSNYFSESNNYMYGTNGDSFPYRYFSSNLRALQMQCTYLHTTAHLIPQMLPFLALQLGRDVNDAPDVWTFLRTSYLGGSVYKGKDWKNRVISSSEMSNGIETKNFERWLYQRDAAGYETEPAIKINHAIKMSTVREGKNFDYIARSGKKIGFDIDSRWPGASKQLAIKVTYFDQNSGVLNLVFKNAQGMQTRPQTLLGDNKLKTVTFVVPQISANGLPNNFEFALEAGSNTSKIVVSMVRVVQTGDASPVVTNPGPIVITPAPSQWSTMDVGTVGAAGTSVSSNGGTSWTVKGSGLDIGGTKDAFQYVLQNASENCTIIAKVTSVQGITGSSPKAGIAMREKVDANSQGVFLVVNPDNSVSFLVRGSTGGSMSLKAKLPSQAAARWLKLERISNTFYASYSNNGEPFTPLANATETMSKGITIGLAVTSNKEGTLCEAKFDNVSPTP